MEELSGQGEARRYRVSVNYPCPVMIRLTHEEREVIYREARESGLSVSRFVAKTLTRHRYPPALKDREALFRLRFLLERAGVNLNQVAKRLNAFSLGTMDSAPAPSEVRETVRILKGVCRMIERSLT